MSNMLKKQDFPIAFPRLFTRPDYDAYDLIHFTESDSEANALEHPDHWSVIATETLAEEICALPVPMHVAAIEENTVPSWLWRHSGRGKAIHTEQTVQQIFTRIVGAAAYKAWKEHLFGNEQQARNFFDETRYVLTQRFIALEPKLAAQLGRDWAYDQEMEIILGKTQNPCDFALSNSSIDAIVSGDRGSQGKIQKSLKAHADGGKVTIAFPDIAHDWQAKNLTATAALDLMAFRHNDGTVNIDALRHAIKLLVITLDLHDAPVQIGFINLAPLLMALALPYDSDAGRDFAASLAALITAEAYAVSAQLAARRGKSADYIQHHDVILRNLRNHRRAAHGDRNDYEKLSVLPIALELKKTPDLALAAAAQHLWDDVLDLVRQHGLRAIQVTTTTISSSLKLFLETRSAGIEPLTVMTNVRQDGETFTRSLSPVVIEALSRLGYSDTTQKTLMQYVVGTRSLAKAPEINHALLQAKGFTLPALEALENYLPQVNDIRLAFTPWILGSDFCRKVLKLSAAQTESLSVDLLRHLGFDERALIAANDYCYGHNNLKGSSVLKPQHISVFALDTDLAAEAKIRMAASVQSFVSGTINVALTLGTTEIERSEKLLLSAWRQGLQAITFVKNAEEVAMPVPNKNKRSVSAFLHTQAKPTLPSRRLTAKASRHMVSLKPAAAKPTTKSKSK